MIILTGGAGFIGSCFLHKLNEMNIKNILVVDHLGTGDKWKNLVGKKYRRYLPKDIFRKKLDDGEFGDEVEAIIHLGACTDTTERDADYMMDNNLAFSKELANFAEWNGIKFIYASSAATYGLGNNGYSDNEFDNLVPLNVYGYSKHAFDLWVIEHELDKNFTGLKFFNVFGPNEYHKGDMASMVYKSYNQIINKGKVRLFKSTFPEYKDGEQKRDFIYVKDVTDVLWNIYNSTDFSGIYNLGTGIAHSWNELIYAVFSSMGKEPQIEYIDMPEKLKSQYQNFTQADMTKLNSTNCKIDFQPLEKSVSDYVHNYLIKEWKHF
jgi:ADP-L-glycero-D-manno-heptose 6-epimerase